MSEDSYVENSEIERFEKESGVAYRDFFNDKEQPISDVPESYNGKSIEEISTLKDIGNSAAASFKDFLKSTLVLGMQMHQGIEDRKLDKEFDEAGMSRVKDNLEWDAEKGEAIEKNGVDLEPSYEPKTIAGGLTYGFGKAGLGYLGASGILGGAGLTGAGGLLTKISLPSFAKTKEAVQIGKVLSPLMNNIAGNVTAFWADKENIGNIIQEYSDSPFAKAVADYWAIDEDDSTKERAFKHTVDALFTEVAAAPVYYMFKYAKQGLKNSKIFERLSKSIANMDDIIDVDNETVDAVQEVAEAVTTSKTPVKATKAPGKTAVVKTVAENVETPTKTTSLLAKEITPAEKKLSAMVKKLRRESPENYAAIRAKALDKFSDVMGIDFSEIDTVKLREFLDTDNAEIDKVVASVYNQEKVANNFLDRMKDIKTEFEANNISVSQRDKAFENSLLDLADSFAATQDAVSRSGRAMGYVSKSQTHKEIKNIINGIVDNADTMDRDALYKVFSEASSIEELSAKFDKLVQISTPDKVGKVKKIVDKFVALEQAGLMTNPHTIGRNIWTGLEMILLGSPEDAVARGVGKTKGFIKKLLGGGENYDLTSINQGMHFAKNFMDNAYEVLKYSMNLISKKATGESPIAKYRRSVSGAKTYMPKSVGNTFSDSSLLGRWGNNYMKYSGVGISEGIDDFMGNVFYRTEAQSRAAAYVERIKAQKNLTKEQADELYKKTLKNIDDINIPEAKNLAMMSEEYLVANAISKKSKKYALEQTFRGGEGDFTKWLTQGMRGPAFFVRPIIPFVKVGATIGIDRFLNDRTFLGLFNPKTWAKIRAGGREGDRVIARQLVGNSILSLGGFLYTSGMITGDYPEDAGERALWKAKGIQPNSLRIPLGDDKFKYISLNGLGLIALGLKTGAKAAQAFDEYDMDPDDERGFVDSLILSGLAIAESALSETAFRYVGDLMNALENRDENTIQKIKDKIGETAINLIPRLGEGLLSDTQEAMQVADTNMEKIIKKLGGSTSNALDFLGRPRKATERFFGPLAGFSMTESEKDFVADTMYEVGAFVSEPYKRMTVDSVSLKLDYNHIDAVKKRMQQMGIERNLERTIKSPLYNSLTNKNDKAKMLKNAYNKVKHNALTSVIRDYPELQEQLKKGVMNKQQEYEPVRSDVNAILDVPTLR